MPHWLVWQWVKLPAGSVGPHSSAGGLRNSCSCPAAACRQLRGQREVTERPVSAVHPLFRDKHRLPTGHLHCKTARFILHYLHQFLRCHPVGLETVQDSLLKNLKGTGGAVVASEPYAFLQSSSCRSGGPFALQNSFKHTRQHQALGGSNLKWPVIDHCPVHVWSSDVLSTWCLPADCSAAAISPRPMPALHVLGSDWRVSNHQALLPCCSCCCR